MQENSGRPSPVQQHPSPGARDLYLLTLGLLAGLVLGPWVLGRVHPPTYNRLFTGLTVASQASLDQLRQQHIIDRERLVGTDVTEAGVEAFDDAYARRVGAILAEMGEAVGGRLHSLQQVLMGLVAAVLAVMVIEAVVPPPLRGGLATARYAILAVWVAIALAQPSLLAQVPVVFTLGLIVVALLAALVPLRRRA